MQVSRSFLLSDLIYCDRSIMEQGISNDPEEEASLLAIKGLAESILEPVIEELGDVHLTAGFHSYKSLGVLSRPSAPKLDQHCAYEKNSRGKQICARGGFAVDFFVSGKNSLEVARFVAENLDFDRLYYYGEDRPLHVSHGPQAHRAVTLLTEKGRRLIPRNLSLEKFVNGG